MGGYPPSLSLFYCDFFASRVAGRSQSVKAGDQLAGIYIASAGFDELLSYWSDRRSLGRLVANECGLLFPPLFYWVDWIPRDLKRARRLAFWRVQLYHFKSLSPEMQRVRLAAGDLASRRDPGAGKTRFVTPQDVLLAMARFCGQGLGERLVQSGLDVQRLEREVLQAL